MVATFVIMTCSHAGVLCAKNHVFRNSVPHIPGGGTVLYVSLTNEKN